MKYIIELTYLNRSYFDIYHFNNYSKESACNEGDLGLIPKSGRSPREENNNPLQYSWLENPMDRGAQRATVHGVSESFPQPRAEQFASRLSSPGG